MMDLIPKTIEDRRSQNHNSFLPVPWIKMNVLFLLCLCHTLDQDKHSVFILKDPAPSLWMSRFLPPHFLSSGPFEKSFQSLSHPHFLSVPLKTDYN